MFYELNKEEPAYKQWPESDAFVSARSSDGMTVKIPVQPVNTLIVGETGYGKTVFTKKFVRAYLNSSDKVYSVFFQIKPHDFEEFMRPHDKCIAYSTKVCPKENLFRWNLVKEIRQSRDWDTELEELASILFEELLEDRRNLVWAEGAKNTFKGYINVILHCYKNCPSNENLINGMRYMNRLQFLQHLAKYKPNHSLLRDYFEYDPNHCEKYTFPKKGSDIMFFLQSVLSKFGGSFMDSDGMDTLHDYFNGYFGERLFLIFNYKEKDSCKIFDRYFLKKIIDEKLSVTSDLQGQMLMVFDEVDKLDHDFGLMHGVTLGRQCGLQIIVSTQSMESLYCIAPTLNAEHITKASLAGFPNIVSFHPGDPETIKTLQMLFGNRKHTIMTMPVSRYGQPMVKVETEPIVKEEEFAGLDVGECIIKLRSAKPEFLKIEEEENNELSDIY